MSVDASKSIRRLTLDEVFQRTTPSNPREEKIVLTPLSKKACLVHGIVDPTILQNREYTSFARPGLDPEIQTMQYEVYVHTRERLMELASAERSKLASKANDSLSSADSSGFSSSFSCHDDDTKKDPIEMEKRRLEKVARRQQKELLRMLAFESKSQQINDKMKKRAEEQAQKELERKKEKRKRDLKAAEDARVRQLRKKAKEETESNLQRIAMQQQFERDKKIQQEKARKEKEQKKRARMEERMRAKKAEMYEMQTKKILEQQRREVEEKMKEREARERAKEEKLELKRLVDAQVAEAKRKEAADRIEANLNAARTKEEVKRANLLTKQAKHDELMSRIKEEKDTEIQQQQERNRAMERKRKQQLQMARKKEEALKENTKSKIEADEARRAEQQRELKKEQDLRKAEREILMTMKRENLARIQRAHAFQQKQTLRKVAQNDLKAEMMKKKKAELLAIRQKNAAEAKIKKDELMAVLDQTRGSGGSSTKIKKLLKKLSSQEFDPSANPQSSNKGFKSLKHDDSETVQTEISDMLLPPPPDDASPFMRDAYNDNISQPYKSPYASGDYLLDMQNLSLKEPRQENTSP